MKWIKQRIDTLLEKYATNEPVELADSLGITVIYEYLGKNDGLYINQNGFKFILVNNNLDYYEDMLYSMIILI